MLFVISLIVIVLLAVSAIWLRNKWIIDTFNSYGVYGAMAGLYIYRRFGLWHIGDDREGSRKEVIHSKNFGFSVDREANIEEISEKEVRAYSQT